LGSHIGARTATGGGGGGGVRIEYAAGGGGGVGRMESEGGGGGLVLPPSSDLFWSEDVEPDIVITAPHLGQYLAISPTGEPQPLQVFTGNPKLY